jgi:gluconolactonase
MQLKRVGRGIAFCLAALLGGCAADVRVEPEAAVEVTAKAVTTVSFTEGPTVDADGNVYFTDTRRQFIMRYTPGGGTSVFREKTNAANGLVLDEQGRLIACEGGGARVTRMDVETGEIEVLAENSEETPITRPNDVTFDGKGRLYFTDYAGARVYRIDLDGGVHQILGAPDIEVPNGIVISPDDRTLYLVEANGKEGGARCLRAYDLGEDGSVSNMRVFHDFYPGRSADGICMDTAGNVYAAAGLNRLRGSSETLDTKAGIHVFSPEGAQIGFHPIWEDTVTNCAFGGEDGKTLYVTAGKTLFSIRTEVAGTGR